MRKPLLSLFVSLLLCGVSAANTTIVAVASTSFTSQTEAIPVTTLYTPTTAGLYRVSVYMETSGESGIVCGQTAFAHVGWKGIYGSYTWPANDLFEDYPYAFVEGNTTIYSVAGQSITFSVTIGDCGTPMPPVADYGVYVTVEKL
jgi:hypothetical protein